MVALIAAVVGLAAWAIVDQTTGSSPSGTGLIDRFNAAMSTNNAGALMALLASDAEIWAPNGETFDTPRIAAEMATETLGLRRDAPVVSSGGFSFTFAKGKARRTSLPTFKVMEVFQVQRGKILRVWLIVPGRDAPFNNAAP